jgi:hypothetical protein
MFVVRFGIYDNGMIWFYMSVGGFDWGDVCGAVDNFGIHVVII